MTDITDRQAMVLETLRTLYRRHAVPPSLRMMADQLGIAPSTVHSHLQALRRKGYVRVARRFVIPVERGERAEAADAAVPSP